MKSKYLRVRVLGERVVIFHELHPDPVYCSKQQWEQFVNGQAVKAFELELVNRKLLIDNSEEDSATYEVASARLQEKHCQAGTLYLMTAQGCNLNCKYCFIPEFARKFGESMLSIGDAIAGINLWYQHIKDTHNPNVPYFVIFYGGEPLLNLETIQASLVHLKDMKSVTGLPHQLNLMVVTNGLLVDDSVVAMCKENGIMVAVSLDGSRDVNDSMRIDNDRLGTYGKVTSSINKLVAAGVKVFGSVTVGPHNINLLSETSDLLEKLNIKKFGFNFIKGKQLIELVGIDGVEEYCRQSAKAVMEYSKTHKRGFEYQLEKKLDAFERKDFFPHDCTCYGSQLVIQPDGQISNCPFFKTGFGHVNEVNDNFRIWNQPLVKEWRKRLPLYHQEFKNNDAKAMCGAGCAWSSKELYGDFLSVDQSSRIFSEEVFNELIWSKQ